MEIEVFTQDEVEVHPEAVERSVALIEELDLAGQRRLVSTDGEKRARFRAWTAREHAVYQALLPTVEEIEKFDSETIPLRVLETVSEASKMEVYQGFLVLHARGGKDPLVVGYLQGDRYQSVRWHMIARWGDVLEAFEILAERAGRLRLEQALQIARSMAAKARAFIEEHTGTAGDPELQLPGFYGV